MANHRKAIRVEIASYAARFRAMQLEAITRALAEHGISIDACPPLVALVAMTGIAQVLALEAALGVTAGHEETRAFVEDYLRKLEATPQPSG